MASSNKRRRSSDCGSNSASKFAAISDEQPPTFISLPEPRIASTTTPAYSMKRRSPLTPPSVTPASVTVSESTTLRRDRCRSPSSRASAILQKVAVVSSTPSTVPSSPRLCATNSPGSNGVNSNDSTPTSTPPDDGGQFPFTKHLPERPEGGYVSFPMFEAFKGCGDEDDESVSPTRG
ncbi:hypothetical protein FN846DRAFT_214650 [Sphaerosporella brunnea]|uniref:Uncharacterized protein n=1 Tax=Sphaerosporella brunnea TaxID=1250544 RepID=A0A5J5F6Z7_9PEZI|nr:hypothetical protein FN846DRAFT_214650 [Sphaerosporella brunnea]